MALLFPGVSIRGTLRLGRDQALPMPRPALLLLPSADARRAILWRLRSEPRVHPWP